MTYLFLTNLCRRLYKTLKIELHITSVLLQDDFFWKEWFNNVN